MKTIQEIMQLPISERKELYSANMASITIDGNKFDNYGAYSFVWEKSYIEEPTRTNGGSMANINNHATILVGHLKIDFSVLSIDYYRKLMKLLYSKNEFVVSCYDIVYNKVVTLKMYFATEEMPKLLTIAHKLQKEEDWEEWIDLVGVTEYTLELIGTNNSLDTVSITYHLNPPDSSTDQTLGESDIAVGDEAIIGATPKAENWQTMTFNGAYKFQYWCDTANGLGLKYTDESVYTINQDLVLYAIWASVSTRTLSYSYGLGTPREDNGEPIYNKKVIKGQAIGALPDSEIPSVTYDDKVYSGSESPYYNGGWYKTPTKSNNSEKLTSNTLYWSDYDSVIYQLYDIREYIVTFENNLTNESVYSIYAKYGETIALPTLQNDSYTFKGWYLDNKKFDGKMPPKNIKLVAVWEQ